MDDNMEDDKKMDQKSMEDKKREDDQRETQYDPLPAFVLSESMLTADHLRLALDRLRRIYKWDETDHSAAVAAIAAMPVRPLPDIKEKFSIQFKTPIGPTLSSDPSPSNFPPDIPLPGRVTASRPLLPRVDRIQLRYQASLEREDGNTLCSKCSGEKRKKKEGGDEEEDEDEKDAGASAAACAVPCKKAKTEEN